jgi:hypothetical protein
VKLGHRAAGYLPHLPPVIAKRFRRQDGAVAVEMVLVSMLLIPLVCGLLDFGMLWQKHQSAESAVRQAARRAAANCLESLNDPSATCKNGSQAEDDADVLLAAVSALGSTDEIEKVVVFNADGTSVSDLSGNAPPGCLEADPPTGIDLKCNVYGPDELAGITSMSRAALKARFNCSASPVSPSAPWCPTSRVRSSATPAFVGVALFLRHQHITGMFGSSAPVKTQAIFRLEPNTYSPIAVYEPDAVYAVTTTTTTTTTIAPSTTTTIEPTPPCPANFNNPMTVAACIAITPTTTTTTTTTIAPPPPVLPPTTVAPPPAVTSTTIAPITTTTTRPPRAAGGNL